MKDLSHDFSLYIHIPFCVSKCAYCDFLSFTDRSRVEEYIDALCREIEIKERSIARKVHHIYIGGGTPSLVWEYFPRLKKAIRTAFCIDEDIEITTECNPESVTEDFIAAAKDFGVTRVSLGVQSLSDPLLKRIGRAHDRAKALKALSLLTDAFPHVNADLMVGLPDQTMADLDRTLDELLVYPLDHISCYGLILEEGTRLFAEAQQGIFRPDDDVTVDLYDRARDRLATAGFDRYEISNFCRNGAVCGYNLSVWQYGEYVGLGLGASSFRRERGYPSFRTKNESDLARYILSPDFAPEERELVDFKEGMKEFVMLGLRLSDGLNLLRFREIFGMDFYVVYGRKIEPVRKYLLISDDHIAIRPEFFYISSGIIEEIIF